MASTKRALRQNAGWLALAFAAISVILAVLVAVQAVELHPTHLRAQWGTPFDAFAAVGTVGTLIWSVATAVQLRRESLREKVQEQARRVAGWLSAGKVDGMFTPIRLINNSNEPVTNVVVYLVWVQGERPVWVKDPQPLGPMWPYGTGEAAEHFYRFRVQRMLRENKHDMWHVGRIRGCIHTLVPGDYLLKLMGHVSQSGIEPINGVEGIEIAFTDAAGKHWVRRADGTLSPLSRSPIDHYGVRRPVHYSQAEAWN